MAPDLSTLDYISPGHANQSTYLFVTIGLLGIVGFLTLVSMWMRVRTLGVAQARENSLHDQKPSPLSVGADRVISGTVEVDGPDDIAVQVTLRQNAENRTHKNNRSHSWKEVSRRAESKPFYLVTDTGETVYVEPGDRVMVVDGLETEYPSSDSMSRLRRCDVKRGERFTAYGDLHTGMHARAASGYRDGSGGWILKPAQKSGRMLFATQAIKERYAPRLRFLKTWALISSILWLGFHALMTVPFAATALQGKRTEARVTNTSTYVTTSKKRRTTHYVVEAMTPEGRALKGEVPRATFEQINSERQLEKRDAKVPTVIGPEAFPDYLGNEAHGSGLVLILSSIFWFSMLFAVWGTYAGKLPWYDQEKFNEPGGSGHWPPSKKPE